MDPLTPSSAPAMPHSPSAPTSGASAIPTPPGQDGDSLLSLAIERPDAWVVIWDEHISDDETQLVRTPVETLLRNLPLQGLAGDPTSLLADFLARNHGRLAPGCEYRLSRFQDRTLVTYPCGARPNIRDACNDQWLCRYHADMRAARVGHEGLEEL